jgi:hypothetical protein
MVFKIAPANQERFGLLATDTVGECGWVGLPEPIMVRAVEAFVAVALESSRLAIREERMEKVNLVDKLAVFTDCAAA